jgi:hypothetical protein
MQAALRPQLLAHLLHMDRHQAYVGMCTERYHNVMPLILSTETKVWLSRTLPPQRALIHQPFERCQYAIDDINMLRCHKMTMS